MREQQALDQGGRILIVDDDDAARNAIAAWLRMDGHTVSTARDGAGGLEMLAAEEYDLLMLDLKMPVMGGLEVLRRVRESQSMVELPVIIITVNDSPEDVANALKLGANDYLVKPPDFNITTARVQTQIRLRRLARIRSEFLGLASHEIRSPLASIEGSVDLVCELLPPGEPMSEETLRLLLGIRSSVRDVRHLVDTFLELHAVEDGAGATSRVCIDLGSLARDVRTRNLRAAERKGIDLLFEPGPGELPVLVDASLMARSIHNLVENAIKFGSAGDRIVLRVSSEGRMALLEVCDTGPGLREDELPFVFVRGKRLANRPTGGETSNRLGLMICKILVERHQGQIGVRNNPDRGLTFWIRLPVQQAQVDASASG